MKRAIHLAQRGMGAVEPNPRVGCVIVYDGRIIGEGYHQEYGGPHAEVKAIASVAAEDTRHLPAATLYVTLEPCAHQGKTPPCANLIADNRLQRVVIAGLDPNPIVAGRGKALLEATGIQVDVGLLEAEARALNRPFFTRHEQHRPYVTLKWAQSADGFLGRVGQRTSITGSLANRLTHQWRVEHQAILVGQQTAHLDNPRLTNYLWPGRAPLRLVWDPDGQLPDNLNLWDGSAPTWVLTHRPATRHPNALTHVLPAVNWADNLQQILQEHHVQALLVEGGAKTLHSFLSAGWWDEYRVWTAPIYLGEGVEAPAFPHPPAYQSTIGTDILKVGYRV